MKDKVKAVFDSKTTWVFLATLAGAFGEKAFSITNALGALVMAAI